MIRQSTEDFQGIRNTLYNTIIVVTLLSYLCLNTQKVQDQDYTINYGSRTIVVYQCRHRCDNCTNLVWDVDNGETVPVEWGVARNMWKISVTSPQFCCNPETALKNEVLKKEKGNHKGINLY